MPLADTKSMHNPPTQNDAPMLAEPERQALLLLARGSIRHGLDRGGALPVELSSQPEPLRTHHACFVTLQLDGDLRGCIGHLEAVQPLAIDVADNAFAAAFRDPRFAPVSGAELDALHIEISVLTPSEPLAFGSEEELIALLRPSIDGIILAENEADGSRRGTFLPSVWEQLPQPHDFLRHLKRKAGLSPDHWSDGIRAWRYRTESFGE